MRRLTGLVALTLALAAAGMLAQPVQVVSVRTGDGETLVCRRVGRGEPVTLIFTHSMYGGEVRETWRADGDALARDRIVAERAAAAEYYATDGRTRAVEGGYEVVADPARVDTLPFRIDQIGRHRLRIDGTELPLADRVDGSAGAALSARQVPLIARLVNGAAGCGG